MGYVCRDRKQKLILLASRVGPRSGKCQPVKPSETPEIVQPSPSPRTVSLPYQAAKSEVLRSAELPVNFLKGLWRFRR